MKKDDEVKLESYFENRNVATSYYGEYKIPKYLRAILPANKNARILDIGFV